MTDDDLIGYLFDTLDPDDRVVLGKRLACDPARLARLTALREAMAPLEADRADPDPPPRLAARTVARMAAYLVEHEPRPPVNPPAVPARPVPPPERPEFRGVGGRFRADLIVAAGLAFFAVGLGLSAVGKLRQRSDEVACPNNLRTLHVGLATYADTHDGRFPQVGVAAYPTAGSFAAALAAAGQCPPGFTPACPVDRSPAEFGCAGAQSAYTYTLGHRGLGGELVGLRRDGPDGENDLLPIAADNPAADAAPASGPLSPHPRGQNVLYVGGQVRFTTTPHAGINGDHIYQNLNGQVAAGLDRVDTALGRAADRP
jgi:hypothetical protein